MTDEVADSLREMAGHRGYKLVRSRRRKPGVGDFGKYGLTDEKGAPLLGIGEDGLTASAADIEDYLRAGSTQTWQQSAKIAPERKAAAKSSPSRAEALRRAEPPRRAEKQSLPAPPRKTPAKPKPKEAPAEPTVSIRSARPADAGALAKLLGQLSGIQISGEQVTRNLVALRKAKGGLWVAEAGTLVGCVGWAILPTLHRGPVGRITVLVVDQDYRRRGLGTQLLAESQASLKAAGCELIEVMSDIDLKNAHNFFRTTNFAQASYRFTRKIDG